VHLHPLDLSGKTASRIHVVVRVRPFFEEEVEKQKARNIIHIEEGDTKTLSLLEPEGDYCRNFSFDHLFSPKSTQQDIYNVIGRPIVDRVLEGYNGTIMAYGQTGTGKTYTMGILGQFGEEHQGLVKRCMGDIFDHLDVHDDSYCEATLSFVQIYLEKLQDLLNPESDNLQLMDTKSKIVVPNMKEIKVSSVEEAMKYVQKGLDNRIMAPTLMNTTSSRSHTILTLNLIKRIDEHSTQQSSLRIVDLAGSERVSKTDSWGERLKEAKFINRSLSALGNVIASLSSKQPTNKPSFAPYRSSKLTLLLKHILGGNSNTIIVATLSPTHLSYHETFSTLKFSQRCMRVTSGAYLNQKLNIDYKQLAEKLQMELEVMRGKQAQPIGHSQHPTMGWSMTEALHDSMYRLYELIHYVEENELERCKNYEASWEPEDSLSSQANLMELSSEDRRKAIVQESMKAVQENFPMISADFNRDAFTGKKLKKVSREKVQTERYVEHVHDLFHDAYYRVKQLSDMMREKDEMYERAKRELAKQYAKQMETQLETILKNKPSSPKKKKKPTKKRK